MIVAVDYSADWYENQLFVQTRTILIICALSLLAGALIFLIITERARRRNRRLYAQLNALADNVEDLVREIGNTAHADQYHALHADDPTQGDEVRDLSAKILSMQEDLRKEIAYVHRIAYIDALTGVGNKAAYMDVVNMLSKQINTGEADFAVATFDLNGLKQINDTCGHDFGDMALTDAAEIITEVFEKNNVFRIGGDEFIVIIRNGSAEIMDGLFGKFEERLEEESKTERPYKVPLSLSKGYAVFDSETDSEYISVFRRADDAMYRDKDEYYERIGVSNRR